MNVKKRRAGGLNRPWKNGDTDPCSFEVSATTRRRRLLPEGSNLSGRRLLRSPCAVCRWEKDGGPCVTRATHAEEKKLREAIVAQPDTKTLPSAFACTKRSDCGVGQSCCLDRSQQLTDCRLS